MIDKQLISEIVQRKLIVSTTIQLHFDNPITRIIKFGSKCSLVVLGDLISC